MIYNVNDDLSIDIKKSDKKIKYDFSNNLFNKLFYETGCSIKKNPYISTPNVLFYINGDERKYTITDLKNPNDLLVIFNNIKTIESILNIFPDYLLNALTENNIELYISNQGINQCMIVNHQESKKKTLITSLGPTQTLDLTDVVATSLEETLGNFTNTYEVEEIYEEEKSALESFYVKTMDYNYYGDECHELKIYSPKEHFRTAFNLYYTIDEDFYCFCPKTLELMEEFDKFLKENYSKKDKNSKVKVK